MSGSASKRKGRTWENDVAKHLSELYSESFIRVPHSGAYIGGKNSVRKEYLHEGQIRAMKGDIIPPANWKHFNCECKSYADFPFHQLLQGSVKILDAWIEQCMDVADENDFNILIMKFNRKGKFIAAQAQPNHSTLFFTRHFNYASAHHGHWFIMDYDLFWELNQEQVKALSLAKE